MSEIEKHLEQAEKHLQKGKSDAALREYLQVLEEVPNHETAAPAAADLYRSLGYSREAADLLSALFERQVAARQSVAAVVTYRKLLKVATPPPRSTFLVARFLEKSSPREAFELYQDAVCAFMAVGHKADALEALESIVRMEATAGDLCQLAELALDLGQEQRAASAFFQAAGLFAGDEPRQLELYKRAFDLEPANVAMAVAYGRVLLGPTNTGEARKVVEILQPFSQGPEATPESRALYGRALLAAGRPSDAAPFLWQLFQQDPQQMNYVVRVIAQLLDSENAVQAVDLARRLEQHQQSAGKLRDLAGVMQKLAEEHRTSLEFLEYLAELFNAASREADYCQTLLQLFELHFAGGNFLRAGECLDRATEIDPYVAGLNQRLDMLRGKIDGRRVRTIATRLRGAGKSEAGPSADQAAASTEEAQSGSTVLEDLLLQSEILLQYSLRSRAMERLERIRKLFPDEELKNQKLRRLCARAGISLPAAPADTGAVATAPSAPGTGVDIARINEMTHNIGRQGSVRSVLLSAVNEVGRHWKVSRAIAVLCTPGKPPSMALEYCAPGVEASDVHVIVRMVGFLQPLLLAHGPVVSGDASESPSAASLEQFAAGFRLGPMMSVPLIEGDEHIGLLLLARSHAAPSWNESDPVVLKTVADQVVLALSHARLRRIVKNLSITEASGLLKRSSYLDVLLAEVRRAASKQAAVTAVLLNFGKAPELARQVGDAGVEQRLQQIGQLISTHIRQNDFAVRYDTTTIALILSATDEKSASFTVERLRPLLGNLRFADAAGEPILAVGIAPAVMQTGFEAEDIVTELVNRAEEALGLAWREGGSAVHVLTAASQ
jgi:tetratricopeptide (TPR) repeat protein/GGDEF domain-containing protein